MRLVAYDYDAQRWVKGPAALPILIAQTRDEIAMLEAGGPSAAHYVHGSGMHRWQCVAALEARLVAYSVAP